MRREFLLARALLAAGIPTPAPVFVAERRSGPFLRDAWLMTRGLDHAAWTQAYAAWRAWRGDPAAMALEPNPAAADALVAALTRAVRRCHERGFYHDDCRAHHWFFRRETIGSGAPAPASPAADPLADWAVIDLDGSLWTPDRAPSERQRRRALARLAASFHKPFWNDADLHLLLESYWCGDASAAAHDFEHVRRLMNRLRDNTT